MLTQEEIDTRKAAMDNATAAELFTKAAEIIEEDPKLVTDCYVHTVFINPETGLVYDEDYDVPHGVETTPKACHCLEGALHEAAGLFYTMPGSPAVLITHTELVRHYDVHWKVRLNETLIKTFDKSTLARMRPIVDENEDQAINRTVYAYSDTILAPMGKEGVIEAGRLLRKAAELAKEA